MKTVILEQPGQLRVIESADPTDLPVGHALVRVHRVGFCGTDWHAYHGRQPFFSYPRILGHELGVEVVSVNDSTSDLKPGDLKPGDLKPGDLKPGDLKPGDLKPGDLKPGDLKPGDLKPGDLKPGDLKPGDRCSVEPYLNCGQCIACRRGKGNCCVNLRVLGVHADGGMRERIVVPVKKLHRSKKLSFDQLALVETLGIGCHAVARAQPQKDENVLVLGAGPIGLSVIPFVQAAGARPIVADVSESRLAFCREQMKVEKTLDAKANLVAALLEHLHGELPTVVIDATGNAGSMAKCFDFIAHGGRIVFVGLFQGDMTFNDPNFHRRECTLMASRNALPGDFTRIIDLIERGEVDTTPWITHRVHATKLLEVFPDWLKPDANVLKAVLEF